MYGKNSYRISSALENIAGLYSSCDHNSARNYRHVLSLLKVYRLGKGKFRVFVEYRLRLFTEKSYIHRLIILDDFGQELPQHHAIDRLEHAHRGHSSHYAYVLETHMSTAVIRSHDTGVGTHYLDVLLRIRDAYRYLVVTSSRRKRRERMNERQFPARGESRGDSYHILLGNTDVDKSLWIDLLELFRSRRRHQIRFEHNYLLILSGKLYHRLAIDRPHLFVFQHNQPSNSLRHISSLENVTL